MRKSNEEWTREMGDAYNNFAMTVTVNKHDANVTFCTTVSEAVANIRAEERREFAEELIAYLDTSEAQAWTTDEGRNDAIRALAAKDPR